METELERHHSTVSDHELKVDIDGDIVVFRERKEFRNVVKNSNEIKSISIHTRFIGGEYVTVSQTMKDGKSYETTSEMNLGDTARATSKEAIDNFKNGWEHYWHPTLAQSHNSDGFADFFKKIEQKN